MTGLEPVAVPRCDHVDVAAVLGPRPVLDGPVPRILGEQDRRLGAAHPLRDWICRRHRVQRPHDVPVFAPPAVAPAFLGFVLEELVPVVVGEDWDDALIPSLDNILVPQYFLVELVYEFLE